MGKWVHVLTAADLSTMTGVCRLCGPVGLARQGPGFRCRTSRRRKGWRGNPETKKAGLIAFLAEKGRDRPYRHLVGDCCERCGFVPEQIRQLDVHHLNHDHSDDRPENLRTLCANCHRMEH